ncbi:hemerythrin domain-containing protein [Nonomuraea sp. NPDC050691]|uniref:hemerythrin domain-containing protein n=1 Tax=Nonomuraea sp. NPDC050691 TaxID=3155661 RepID=UPI0033D8642B
MKLHDTFRRDLAELRSGSMRAPALREHCLTFCEALHAHHSGEDDVLFPHLDGLHPELAAVLDRLRDEHRVVARLLARIRDLVDSGEPVEGGADVTAAGGADATTHGSADATAGADLGVAAGVGAGVATGVGMGVAGEVGEELERLARELEAHLDYEEEQLVPLLNAMTDMPENL